MSTMNIRHFLHRIRFPGFHDPASPSTLPSESLPLPPPTLETLFTLDTCLQTTIPYENFSIYHPPKWSEGWVVKNEGPTKRKTRPIRIDFEGVYKKMVENHRGGFCLELNMLYTWSLQTLGYTVQKRTSKIIIGFDDDSLPSANRHDSHLLLIVTLPTPQPPPPPHLSHLPLSSRWICDIGAADRSPLTPLPLLPNATTRISGGAFLTLHPSTWCGRKGWMYLNTAVTTSTMEKAGYRHFCFFEDVDVEEEWFEVVTDHICGPYVCPADGGREFATLAGKEGEKIMLIGKEVEGDAGRWTRYCFTVKDGEGVEVERVEFGGEGPEKDWEKCQEVLRERFGIWGFDGDV